MSAIVETYYGRMKGSLDRGVTVFRGVPYAQAPLGPLRFQAPEPLEPREGLLDCSAFGAASPQNERRLGSVYPGFAALQDEACLTLNVWTPDVSGMPKPVLVWIHGGGFIEGAGSDPGLCGRALARRGDVVVVTLQYRLGALGFLHAGDVCDDPRFATPNLGLLDQAAALRWIQGEIDAFGGDPSNVTLIGHGSGATSAACLLAMPPARECFRRVILQSGRYAVARRSEAARSARAFLDSLGIAPEHAARLFDTPIADLLGAQQRLGAAGGAHFRPVVDGQVLPDEPLSAVARGAGRGVPMIVGSNLDETRVRELMENRRQLKTREEVEPELRRILHTDAAHVRELISVYAADRPHWEPERVFAATPSDLEFRLPALRMAEAQSAHEPRVHEYLFRWAAPGPGARLGAFHGLEVPFVFGTVRQHALGQFMGPAEHAKAVSRTIRDAWLSFAKSGRPELGIDVWPTYEPVHRRTLVLDEKPTIEEAPLDAERRAIEAYA